MCQLKGREALQEETKLREATQLEAKEVEKKLRSAVEENNMLKFHNNRITKKVEALQRRFKEVPPARHRRFACPPALITAACPAPQAGRANGKSGLVQFWHQGGAGQEEGGATGRQDRPRKQDTRERLLSSHPPQSCSIVRVQPAVVCDILMQSRCGSQQKSCTEKTMS
jgi:hypothetical protein